MFSDLGKPVFGYVANPFGAYLLPGEPQRRFYSEFHDIIASDMRNTYAVVSPHLSALLFWHTGVRVPVVRPLGIYTYATYRPSLRDVLVTKQIVHFWDIVCVLNQFSVTLSEAESARDTRFWLRRYNATRFVHLKQLKDSSWRNWARHRAAVMLPYDPQLMTFYELYAIGVPLLVPGPELLPVFIRYGYTNLRDFAYTRDGWEPPPDQLSYFWAENAESWELRWWSSLSDFDQTPHLLRWTSVPELLALLYHSDLEEVSERMRRETDRRLISATNFWQDAFIRALS